MVSRVLCTEAMEETYTADNLKNKLLEVVNEWAITDKIVAITTDNAAKMLAAVRLLKWRHLPCFAHTLNFWLYQT